MRWAGFLLASGLSVAAVLWGCTRECWYDTDCGEFKVCSDGLCQDADLTRAKLGLCSTDLDCGATERCYQGSCVDRDYVPPSPDGGTGDGGTSDGGSGSECPAPPFVPTCENWDPQACPCIAGNYLFISGCSPFTDTVVTVTQDGCSLSVILGGYAYGGEISANGDVNLLGGAVDCTGSRSATDGSLELTCGGCGHSLRRYLDPAPSVEIPTGAFTMGSDDPSAESDEKPAHTVELSCFRMDKYEVTYRYYAECVAPPPNYAGSPCPLPPGFNSAEDLLNPAVADQPVRGVSYDAAAAYCTFRGQRLPTEAQWERAARGTDGRTYPWGDDASMVCDSGLAEVAECNGDAPAAYNAHLAGASPEGIVNLIGNVREWVRDAYDPGYYSTSPTQDPQGPSAIGNPNRVVRGGSWRTPIAEAKGYSRDFLQRTAAVGDPVLEDVGFRCVRERF